jgi:hypothetical protein
MKLKKLKIEKVSNKWVLSPMRPFEHVPERE